MGFRWRVRVFPGVRLNVSKRGVSTSYGGGPLTVTVSKRGVTSTASLPGTGLSYVHRHKGARKRPSDAPPQRRSMAQFDTVRPSHPRRNRVGIGVLIVGMLAVGWLLTREAPVASQQAQTVGEATTTTLAPLPPRRPDGLSVPQHIPSR